MFHKIAQRVSEWVGSPKAFILAIVVVFTWALSGPIFGYSDTWQLIINTGTTILTFLMVFLIQNTQNRDNRTIHLKLDELIRSMTEARNKMLDIEDESDDEIARIQKEFIDLSKEK
jgi:low affinity Fe/Cu permease